MATARGAMAVLIVTAAFLLVPVGLADAQDRDEVRFVFTPQIWLENIPKNGFASSSSAGAFGGFQFAAQDLDTNGASPTAPLFPQWGGQFAAQLRRWTLAVGVQYISFSTSSDLVLGKNNKTIDLEPDAPNIDTTWHLRPDLDTIFGSPGNHSEPCPVPLLDSGGNLNLLNILLTPGTATPCGTKVATERIHVDRIDMDLTLSYFFPDVIKDVMDLSLGGGFKWIRASGERSLESTPLTAFAPPQYLLKNGLLATKASFLDQMYAATVPATFNFHLTSSGKWLLPVTATPLIGWNERTDQVFGYKSNIAYGGTLDAGVRYVFENGLAIYAGYRGQAIQGLDLFVAHGPLFNMSVPLGGK